MKAYSVDLRTRVVLAYQDNPNIAQVARTLHVGESSVRRYVRMAAAGSTLEPRRPPGRRALLDAHQHELLRLQVQSYPDATLREHVERFAAQHGQRVSLKTMDRLMDRLSITRKKDRPRHRAVPENA